MGATEVLPPLRAGRFDMINTPGWRPGLLSVALRGFRPHVFMADRPLKLAVLVSGSGTTLQNLLDAIRAGTLNASVEIVIGSKPGLKGLERAASAKVMNFV